MVRGRKSKKHSHARDDSVSAEDEKLPVRRRGRPQKLSRDDFDDQDEVEKIEEEHERGEETKGSVVNKSIANQDTTENGKKRKRAASQVNENADLLKEENVVVEKQTCGTDSIKSVGFRQIGSRRKNKPRRAAEVGVECV